LGSTTHTFLHSLAPPQLLPLLIPFPLPSPFSLPSSIFFGGPPTKSEEGIAAGRSFVADLVLEIILYIESSIQYPGIGGEGRRSDKREKKRGRGGEGDVNEIRFESSPPVPSGILNLFTKSAQFFRECLRRKEILVEKKKKKRKKGGSPNRKA